MAESPDRNSSDRHATWVALRTLRQRPKVVDHTHDGQPVYEVRSVRLVLPGDAGHFKRLVTCSRCGKEVAGAPVLEPADLERPPQPVICRECVQAAGMSVVPSTERRYVPPKPSPIEHVPGTPAAVVAERQDAAEGTQTRPYEELVGSVADLRAELAGVSAALADIRSEMDLLSRSSRALTGMKAEVDRRLAELAERSVAGVADAGRSEAVERRMDGVEARLAAAVDAQRAELHAHSVALTGVLEGQRTDLEDALAARVGVEVAAVSEAVTELVRSQSVIEGRINALAQHASAMAERVDALSASADAVPVRLRALEQRVEESLDKVAALVEAQRREFDARLVAAQESRRTLKTAPGSVGGDLLDALERQLQEAEGRLAQMTGPSRGSG